MRPIWAKLHTNLNTGSPYTVTLVHGTPQEAHSAGLCQSREVGSRLAAQALQKVRHHQFKMNHTTGPNLALPALLLHASAARVESKNLKLGWWNMRPGVWENDRGGAMRVLQALRKLKTSLSIPRGREPEL